MASTGEASVRLQIAGTDFHVARLSGRMGLSTLFRFEVDAFASSAAPAPKDVIGAKAVLTRGDAIGNEATIHAIVTDARRHAAGAGTGSGSYVLEPAVAALAVGRDHRLFQEKSATDVIKAVLEKAGVDSSTIRWAVQTKPPVRPYITQYGESDWAFIERLAREEGIFYWFDFTDSATVLVLADDSTGASSIDGTAAIPFHDDANLRAAADSVVRVARTAIATSSATRLRDYNFAKPRLVLDSKAGSGPLEIYDAPGRFGAPADGDRLAKVELEARRARRIVTTGESACVRLWPGRYFELTDHPVASCNGKLLVVELELGVEQSQTGGDGPTLKWTAIPLATPFRAPRGKVTATTGGVQTAQVVGAPGEEIHPDATGRVRAQHHWDREGKLDDKASTWMRVGQFPLGGSMIMPRVGWDVLVGHHEGDVDAPFVMSHLYDGLHPVPYALPANKTRTAWQTATTPGGGSTNEMRFEDKKGSEEVFINSSKDTNVVVGHDRTESVGVNHEVTIGANHDVTVASNMDVSVTSQQQVTIGGSESMTVGGNREATIGTSETITIGGSRTVSTTGGSTLNASGGRSLTVGGTMTAVAALGVSRSVLGSLNVTVGGSWVQAAAAGLANMTLGAGAETVGGAKLNIGAAGCTTSVKGAAAETVGGAYVVATGGSAGESATGTLAITVGGAFVADAPSIDIEADSEIVIRCGASSITIHSSSVEIKSPLLASPGANVDKGASTINHN
jgi:type VI secretion system secreted protein VgrG